MTGTVRHRLGRSVRGKHGKYYFQSFQTCTSTVKPSDACKHSNGSLNTSYPTGNHGWIVNVAPGEPLTLSIDLMDYDFTSGDDRICQTSKTVTLDATTVSTLNKVETLDGLSDSGGCKSHGQALCHRLPD